MRPRGRGQARQDLPVPYRLPTPHPHPAKQTRTWLGHVDRSLRLAHVKVQRVVQQIVARPNPHRRRPPRGPQGIPRLLNAGNTLLGRYPHLAKGAGHGQRPE